MSAYLLPSSTFTTSRRRGQRPLPSESLVVERLPQPPRLPHELHGLARSSADEAPRSAADDGALGLEPVEPVTRTIRPASAPPAVGDLRDVARRHSGLVALAVVGVLGLGFAAIAAAAPAISRLERGASVPGLEAVAAARLGGPRAPSEGAARSASAGTPVATAAAAPLADEARERTERVRRALRDELAAIARAATPECRVRDLRYRGDLEAEVVVEPVGRVSSLTLSGRPSLDVRAGACLDGRLRAAVLPAFEGEPLTVTVYARL